MKKKRQLNVCISPWIVLLENHCISSVAIHSILLAGCAMGCVLGADSCGLQKRLRPCACLVKVHLSPQFHATNGAAPVFSFINVTGTKLSRALFHLGLCAARSTFCQQELAAPGAERSCPYRQLGVSPGACWSRGWSLRSSRRGARSTQNKLGWNWTHWPAGKRLCILLDILVSYNPPK